MANTKTPSQADVYLQAAKELECDRVDEINKQRKVYLVLMIVFAAIAALAIIVACIAILVRKEPEPTALLVDKSTGYVQVLKPLSDQESTFPDVVDKSQVANWVIKRYQYDWYTISNDFEAIKLMSSSSVFSEYDAEIKDKNSSLNTLKDKGKIKVSIISTSLMDEHTAQVRFTSEKVDSSGKNFDGSPVQRWLATIKFQYVNKSMTELERNISPLGLEVVSAKKVQEAQQ